MPLAPLARLTREVALVIAEEKKRRGVDWPVTHAVVEENDRYRVDISISIPSAAVEERD